MLNLRTPLLATAALLCALAPWAGAGANANNALADVIAARGEEDRARDGARHPQQTLEFFQLAPGMTVAEGLPGGGWYTTILANYLGSEGSLYGVNYADRMYSMFSFATPEWVAGRVAATAQFPAKVASLTDNGISARGFTFESVPDDALGTVDRVLLIRALHNLNRFEQQAGTRSAAISAVKALLKPGGLLGVVQHRAPESATDEWADGNRGYLKQSAVIDMFTGAGFELVAQSEINANPQDNPGADDIVWRLPPSLRGAKDDPERRETMLAIGESDRMTLLFRKASGSAQD